VKVRDEQGEERIQKRTGDQKTTEFADNEELIGELARIQYQPKTWNHGPYTYIISR